MTRTEANPNDLTLRDINHLRFRMRVHLRNTCPVSAPADAKLATREALDIIGFESFREV